ncbi:MAG: tetraacyldisaccharide 4'-kinase [Flavobacteriales bacterium]|nr:tetraacyldisaccharide 4'-kinase [Flavobacteriales bacterium]
MRLLLFPFSLLYGLIMELRNYFYDRGLLPSASFEVPTIAVGNLSVGGSGKTPMVKYLIELLGTEYKVAVLSRGYGRKTTGYRIVESNDIAANCGDEPLEIKNEYLDIPVCVCENRVLGMSELIRDFPDTELVLLDDAFQHRALKADIYLLLSSYGKPFFKDHLLPLGRLREMKRQVRRADALIFTKGKPGAEEFKGFRPRYSGPVFYSYQQYPEPVQVNGPPAEKPREIILVSGVAQPLKLEEEISRYMDILFHFDNPDHHLYGKKDMELIGALASEYNNAVLTTPKDWVKLKELIGDRKTEIWVQRVMPAFGDDAFDQYIREKLKTIRDGSR